VLPVVLIIGEMFFLRTGVQVRGSISAYYHTSMRDLFVGGLTVIGFLLLTYMAGQKRRLDWWLSSTAGIGVLGLTYFPTMRPDLADGAPLCGTTPEPAGCSPVQQLLHETPVATIHFTCAAVFILSLAGISFYFACRARRKRNEVAAAIHRICGYVILAAVGWIALGGVLKADVGPLTPLYLGEIVSVWAFAFSWLTAARYLLRLLIPGLPRPTAAKSQVEGPAVRGSG
jgi:hypothetical protein